MLNDGATNRIDPILLLLIRVSEEEHGGVRGGEFERRGLTEQVLGALNGEAIGHRDDAAGDGGGCSGVGWVLEP